MSEWYEKLKTNKTEDALHLHGALRSPGCEEDGLDIFIASERLEVLIPERN